ncbi:hypothetical protein Peur_018224 [Populus x canadensis]
MRIKSRNRRSTEKEEDELSDLFLIIFCARISINNNITNSLSLLLHFFCYLSLLLLLGVPALQDFSVHWSAYLRDYLDLIK